MAQCHLDHIVIAINDPRALNVYHAICGGETVVHTSRCGSSGYQRLSAWAQRTCPPYACFRVTHVLNAVIGKRQDATPRTARLVLGFLRHPNPGSSPGQALHF